METDAKKCYYLIKEYIEFFKDKHFIFSYYSENDFDSAVVQYLRNDLKKKLVNQTVSSIEGIWTSPDSSQQVAIQKFDDGTFKASKIESKTDSFPEGFVYFTLTPKNGQYIVKEYNSFVSTAIPAKQNGNLLQIWNHAMWGKIYPEGMSLEEKEELATWKENNHGLTFKRLDQDFAYLKIPTFYNNDNAIQRLVSENDSLIRNTKYLIVDLTGNGGGNTGWVYFLSYFMTSPIVQPSSLLRVTPDNVRKKLPEIEPFVNNPISEEYKKYFPEEVLALYKKTYQELPTFKEEFYPIPAVTFPLDSITSNPKKIALMVYIILPTCWTKGWFC